MTNQAAKILEEYKFKNIGNFYIANDNFIVEYEDKLS